MLVIITIATIHFIALAQDLYYFIWWLDIPQHFLGGAWLALTFLWLSFVIQHYKPTFFHLFLAVCAVGVAWEVYEYVFGISYGPLYTFDTSKDLLMDCMGAITAYLVARQFLLPEPVVNT